MNISEVINTLQRMATAELAAKYEEMYGKPPRSRHPAWLRKRIAYRLQENLFGGLSGPARAMIEQLAAEIELPLAAPAGHTGGDRATPSGEQLKPGSVLQRQWHDQQIRVEVLTDGFEWNGECYRSLSAVAKAITNAKWNGRLFFGLTVRST